MQAIQIQRFGGAEVLELRELPDPVPAPSEVLLAVEVAGVNRADILVRTGRYHRAGQPPLTLASRARARCWPSGPTWTISWSASGWWRWGRPTCPASMPT